MTPAGAAAASLPELEAAGEVCSGLAICLEARLLVGASLLGAGGPSGAAMLPRCLADGMCSETGSSPAWPSWATVAVLLPPLPAARSGSKSKAGCLWCWCCPGLCSLPAALAAAGARGPACAERPVDKFKSSEAATQLLLLLAAHECLAQVTVLLSVVGSFAREPSLPAAGPSGGAAAAFPLLRSATTSGGPRCQVSGPPGLELGPLLTTL